MAVAYPSGYNTFVPSFDATGHLVVAYSRNPKDFAVNQYCTLTPVKRSVGYFLQITAEQAARVTLAAGADRMWADGHEAPKTNSRLESFQFQPYNTLRYLYEYSLGYKAQEQADWKILASHAAIAAQNAMTFRTVVALAALELQANYDVGGLSNHVQAASAWSGSGNWETSTVAQSYIKKSILAMAYKINQDTLGAVGPRDLVLVVTPYAAKKMAATEELQDALKQQVGTYAWIEGKTEIRSGRWGLPEYLYGIKVVIEDTQKITSAKGGTRSISPALTQTTALMLARPGGLTSMEGAASYSTGHFFNYEEMTVESKDDPDNRRTAARIVDDFDFKVVAPASGCVATSIVT